VSIYSNFDEKGRVAPYLHHIISDLTTVFLGDHKTKHVVLGGDFNTSTQWESDDKKWPGLSPSLVFKRLDDFGFVSATAKTYSRHVQTYRNSRSTVPWQNDYLYLSDKLAAELDNCMVINDEPVMSLSDHNPIVIDLFAEEDGIQDAA
jgi:exonuclease III